MQVLLVEDDPQTGESIEMMLRSWNHDIDWVQRGEAAVAMAVNKPYDLILLDVMLPGMDGYEVLQQLRAAEVEAPVILQSGLVSRDEAAKGFSLGVSDYLIKPFTKSQLASRIDLTMARVQPREKDAEAVDPLPPAEPERPVTEEVTLRPPAPREEPATSDEQERRLVSRSRVLKGGKIIYRAATSTMDCVVLNLSESGAALQPADTPHCPDVFTLQIHHGPTYKCTVCWRYRNKLGVRFV